MSDSVQPAQRRHDLDALRAFAMLLGIVLHASLAYIGIQWIVSDEQTSPALSVAVSAIHGFRMPLFFLLSGFFTAMLYQRRGPKGLIAHRLKRIALPLAIGTVTVEPAIWVVIIAAGVMRMSGSTAPAENDAIDNIWSAAAWGDLDAVRFYAASDGVDLDQPDPSLGTLPLSWAAAHGHEAVVEYLLEHDADPNARNKDQSTPLHTAAFFGEAAVVQLLLEAGSNPQALTANGETPVASTLHNEGITGYICQLLSVQMNFDEISQGREAVRDLLAEAGSSAPPPDSRARQRLIEILFGWPIFHHLWFLWFLCWLVVGFLVAVTGLKLLRIRSLPQWLVGTPVYLLLVIPMTVLFQWPMSGWGTAPGFGPDTSVGLLPIPHVLGYYAVFYGFGAVLYASTGAIDRVSRFWWIWLILAIALLVPGLPLGWMEPDSVRWVESESGRRALSAIIQSTYPWLMSLGLIGLFRTVLARERAWVSYLSDSSYWLYIAHLPIILLGQMALAQTELPLIVKMLVLTLGTTGLLLVVYHFCVRHTLIGRTLNGSRRNAQSAQAAAGSA